MTKPIRFPNKLEVWVPDSISEGLDRLASDQLLTKSDHIRQALRNYLIQVGAWSAAPQRANGHQRNDNMESPR